MSHSGLGLPGLVRSALVRADVTRLDKTAPPVSGSHSALPLRPGVLSSLLSYWAQTTCHVTYSPDRDATCARRRQLGWFVNELPWGLEPHDIPIGEQWGGR
jgi:hypothetical protein